MKTVLTAILIAFSLPVQAQPPAERAALGLAQAGKTAEAIAAFREIVAAEPRNADAADALAQLYYSKGRYQDSYNTAMLGLAGNPGHANLSIARAKAAIRLDRNVEAIQLMDGLINIDDGFFYAYYVKGQALDAQDKPEQAIEMYSRCITLNPRFPMAWYDRASDFYTLGHDEQALPDIIGFLKLAPDHDAGLNLRGKIYSRMNRPDEAIVNFSAAIAANPQQFLAYTNRGQAYELVGKQREAEADYRKAIAINTSYPAAHYYLAALLHARKDNEAALEAVREALTLRPQETAYHALAGAIYLATGKDSATLAEAEIMIRGDARNMDGWTLKASALCNMRQFVRSLETLNSALRKFPETPRLYALRSFVYRQQGNTAAARADEAKARPAGTK